MIARWLIVQYRLPTLFPFTVLDYSESGAVTRGDLVEFLSDKLVEGLVNTEWVYRLLEQADLGKLLRYLRDRVTDRKLPTMIGDFGEILVAQLLAEMDEYVIPIPKLRFREKRNWPMRLTDVLAVKRDEGGRLAEVCLCEVKTRTRWRTDCELVGADGCKELEKEGTAQLPEIVSFVADKLVLLGDVELADALEELLLSANPFSIPRRFILALLFDERAWREVVLERLEGEPITSRDFSARIIRIANLRALIDASYAWVIGKYSGSTSIPGES